MDAANPWETIARQKKSFLLAAVARNAKATADDVARFTLEQWKLAAQVAGVREPSAITKAMTVAYMRDLERIEKRIEKPKPKPKRLHWWKRWRARAAVVALLLLLAPLAGCQPFAEAAERQHAYSSKQERKPYRMPVQPVRIDGEVVWLPVREVNAR